MSTLYDVNRTWAGGGWRDSQGESERHERTFNNRSSDIGSGPDSLG